MITTIDSNITQVSKEIMESLNTLYSTPAGTVPCDRAFGIDMSLLDKPINVAKALLTAEYISKTKKYESRATVVSVEVSVDERGVLTSKVVIR